MTLPAPILLELTASDSHLAMLTPVVRELKRRGLPLIVYSDCEILRKPSNVPALEALGVPFVRLAEAPLPGPDLDWELRAAPLRREIERHVARVRPSAVVVLNDRNFPSNTFVKTARRLGLPSILLQESMRKDLFQRPTWRKLAFRWRRRLMFRIEGGLRMYGQGGCDWYAAWGETSRAYFERVGVPASRIRITGNPRFDQLATEDWSDAAHEARRKLGMREGEFPLTFLSSPIETMLIIMAEMKRGLGILATTGSTAPFVGLLGTTMGIVTAFQAMSASGGSGSLAGITGGVAEALITTAFGLIVAIPAVWLYNYFSTKIDFVSVEMTYTSKELIDYLIKSVGSEFGRSIFTKEFQTQKASQTSGPISR
jgi:hypothetical protein